jgi:response regulator of citrate/malate metabolism
MSTVEDLATDLALSRETVGLGLAFNGESHEVLSYAIAYGSEGRPAAVTISTL